jgi:hypothetical protein
MLPKGLLGRGGPMIDADGLFADCGLRSCTGDSIKHSSRDMEVEVDSLLLPAPKRKGGNALSALRVTKLPVVKPFVLAREGRTKIDFLRLIKLAIECWNV